MNKKTSKTTNKQASSSLTPRSVVITKQQLLILTRIYNFRFVSTAQLQQLLAKKQLQQVQQRLNLLLKRGYIGRNFSNQDRLTGRYASYYLLPKGMKVLRQHQIKLDVKLNSKVLHNIYKDKTASTRFINHCLGVGDINCHLKRLYGEDIEFISKSKLADYDFLPNPLPDAFIRQDKTQEYFLEYCEEIVPFFVYRKRIKQYVEVYIEEGAWKDATGTELPTIRLVAETPVLQRRLKRFITKYLNNLYMGTGARFLITNLERLKTSDSQFIWSVIIQEEE